MKPSRKRNRRKQGNGKPGRPVELTDAVLASVAKHVAQGNYIETAADIEGVSIHSVRKLMREGAHEFRRAALDGDTPKPELQRAVTFAMAMKRARARAELDDVAAIKRAGKTQWQAHAWRLERRQPDRWSRTDRHEHAGPKGGAIPFVGTVIPAAALKDLTDQELDVLERIVSKAGSCRDSDGGTDPG